MCLSIGVSELPLICPHSGHLNGLMSAAKHTGTFRAAFYFSLGFIQKPPQVKVETGSLRPLSSHMSRPATGAWVTAIARAGSSDTSGLPAPGGHSGTWAAPSWLLCHSLASCPRLLGQTRLPSYLNLLCSSGRGEAP